MKRWTLVTMLAAAALGPAQAGTNIGVSIGISQPGMYGRIDIGSMPPAAVVYAQPIVIAPTPVAVYQRPIYLYVPPAHQAHWGRYCGAYAACGQPVYFVREAWVRDRYARAYGDRDRDERGSGHGQKPGRGHKHGDD
jgi:hypothetical protein